MRVDIVKGEDLIIFVYLLGRNLAVDDLAEQTIHAALLGWLRVAAGDRVGGSVTQANGLALSGSAWQDCGAAEEALIEKRYS
ncbi:hypothetical protein YSKK_30420 [Halopseudomonas aestusnigri]|nr:hypothetical protein YSKK_30420 [Halopseudomonas aestusnigri]